MTCSSSPNPNRRSRDAGDRIGTAAGLLALAAAALAVAAIAERMRWSSIPGEVRLPLETVLHVALAPMPEIPDVPEEPPPDIAPEPEPEPVAEPEPPPPEPIPEPEPESRPEAEIAPSPPPPPPVEAAPSAAAQPEAETDGDRGEEDAVRAAWLAELRRRIERSKFYPGAARYARESGTVLLRVDVGADGRIGAAETLLNTGSELLEEGARGILRRAAAEPLGAEGLREGFRVDVPITYRLERR